MPPAQRERLGEEIPAGLEDWLDRGDPPVFLGFGSMPVLDPDAVRRHRRGHEQARPASDRQRELRPANVTLPHHLRVAGVHVPFRKLNRASLEGGLSSLFDPALQERSWALGLAIKAEGDGLPRAAQLLEDWLVTAEPMPL
jgi:hypothetical protein